MRLIVTSLIFIASYSPFSLHASPELRFFTHSRKQLFFSDPREAALELSMIEKNRFRGKIGNFVHLLSLETDQSSIDIGIDAMMLGTFHGESDWETPLDTIDGRIGGYFELGHTIPAFAGMTVKGMTFKIKASFEHISSHLSDGKFRGSVRDEEKPLYTSGSEENLYVIRLDNHFSSYSREFLKLIFSYEILNTKFYAGLSRSVHIPEPFPLRNRLGASYQGGVETSLRLFRSPISLFFSSDFQWKKDYYFLLEENYHLGLDLKGFRIFANYYDGFDQRGIYWNLKDRHLAFGFSLPMF